MRGTSPRRYPPALVFAPLPPVLAALSQPVAVSTRTTRLIASATLDAGYPVVDQHRATAVFVSSLYAGQAVPRTPALTPVLHLLTQPPCLVLVHPPAFDRPLWQTVVAIGPRDRAAGPPGWHGTVAHQLLQAWHARMVVLEAAKPVRGVPAVLPA